MLPNMYFQVLDKDGATWLTVTGPLDYVAAKFLATWLWFHPEIKSARLWTEKGEVRREV
jgi:hypothetical protein